MEAGRAVHIGDDEKADRGGANAMGVDCWSVNQMFMCLPCPRILNYIVAIKSLVMRNVIITCISEHLQAVGI